MDKFVAKEFSYDQLPYSNLVFTQTHPDRLCALARLFGLDAPDISSARVLELGCGNGMNLLSQAFSLPDAFFLGVDLAKNHIDYANNSAAELNLKNIEFKQCDLMEINAGEFGKFDYIIAHGLISWIPEAVREKTFEIYEQMLTEKGVGYISYNTYPGWHYRQMVRGIARIHTKDIQEPTEKIETASKFVKFLAENTLRNDFYKSIIEKELDHYANPTIAFHDNLAEINEPYYFHEFAEKLNEHNLQFLAESQFFSMSTYNYPPDLRSFLEKINDPVGRGQYMDFLIGRAFRQTLFCRQNFKLQTTPSIETLDKLYLTSPLNLVDANAELADENIVKFSGLQKEGVEINHPLTKVFLYLLGKKWGEAVGLNELLSEAENYLQEKGVKLENRDEDFQITSNIILQIVSSLELIEIHSYQKKVYKTLDEKPKINSLAEWQMNKGDLISATYERIIKLETPVLRKLIELLDGTNTRGNIYKKLVEFIEADERIENKNEMLENLADEIDRNLNHFAKSGLFVPNK